jgi:ABC-type transport system involved in multi-copper enzyme maturation permease subunit
MSSIPPATSDPFPPAAPEPVLGPLAPATPGETAPSAMLDDAPALARIVGVVGLFLTVLGLVVIATTKAIGPRIVSEGWGFVFAGCGFAALLYHAATDHDQEIRRIYGLVAGFLLLLALIFGVLPGPLGGTGAKEVGYYVLQWGVGAGLLALLFAIPFARHETDESLRTVTLYAMLGVGAALSVGTVLAGVFDPDFLAGPGLPLALLGVGFLCAYADQVGTDDGLGYTVALALAAVGAAALFYAFARTVFPTVLFDGPSVLRNQYQALDRWAVAGRAIVILARLGVVALGALGKYPLWVRAALAAVGLASAGVFVAGSLNTQLSIPPAPFLVPGGLILGFLGGLYLAIGLGLSSDLQFVTLARRELSAYFLSPMGYLVLGGMAACQWFGYYLFYRRLEAFGRQQVPMPEPIVGEYLLALIPILCVILPIPALTMRLLSEEKRSGSLEVLLTSPVDEGPVVLSKFFSTWLFFLICWLPAGLFLIAVRVEAGTGFDYRPLLSFYAALAACSAAFVACGVFFSALTSNQIVSAVLTFMVLLLLVVCFFVKRQVDGLSPTLVAFLTRLSFIDMWQQSLDGQLAVRDVLVWVSAAVFGLFLSVKVLEARKWN